MLGLSGCLGESGSGKSIIDLYVEAVILKELDQNDEAISKLDEAVRRDETFSLAYSLQGDLYQQKGEYEKSAEFYEKAALLNPWSFYDFFNLGRVYEAMKRFTDAVKAYVRACEIDPNHLQAHINTARCFKEIEDYEQALIYGRRAEQLNPDVVEIQEILGSIYESKGDHAQAIRSFKRALELDSGNPRMMTSLAVAYLRAEQPQFARELLENVVKIDPENANAYRHLGYCYLRLYEQSAQLHSDAVAAGNTDQAYLDSLTNTAKNMIEASINNYLKAISIDQSDWDAHRGLGVAYMISGKTADDDIEPKLKEKALFHWRTSLQLNPDQPRAERLRRLIAQYRMRQ